MDNFLVFLNGTGGTILMLGLVVLLVFLIWLKRFLEKRRENSNVRRTFTKTTKNKK